MSVSTDVTERQLKFGLIKVSLSLVALFLLVAVAITLRAGSGQSIAINALMICLAFGFLTNGSLAVLKMIDWFEDRKQRRG